MFIQKTNKDECKNYKICYSSKTDYDVEKWKDLFEYNPNDQTDDFGVFKDFVTIGKKIEGMNHLYLAKYNKNTKLFDTPFSVPRPKDHMV